MSTQDRTEDLSLEEKYFTTKLYSFFLTNKTQYTTFNIYSTTYGSKAGIIINLLKMSSGEAINNIRTKKL